MRCICWACLRYKWGQSDTAVQSIEAAISNCPNNPYYHNNLGKALESLGRCEEAIAACRQAIGLKPGVADVHNNLGNALTSVGQLDEAAAACRHAITLAPRLAEAHSNLGHVLKAMGEPDEAIASFRQAIELKPDLAGAHSNLVYAMHFHPPCDARMLYEEHRRWNYQHAEPLKKFIRPHANDRNPDRRLRIGHVSRDFREHPVGRFLLPLVAGHDPERFEATCYCDVQPPDRLTSTIRQHAEPWRNILGLSDEQAAELIREDQIDILVDPTMHMARNRMLLFARKPAPVQVTYLAYWSTTGLDTMDYRLTDPHLDPPGINDRFYSERSIRLPETYWCYFPVNEPAPEISALSALSDGGLTFGSLNNFCKVSRRSMEMWIQLLCATPKSRLILHAHEGHHRQRAWDLLEHEGVDPRRLTFVGRLPVLDYLILYRQIDIGVDRFPCNGGTTTCDALWMGVPVVSMAGNTAVGRGGVSVLRNIGLTELIAETPEQYVRAAADLTQDLPRLSELRRTLRRRMQASLLMNAAPFISNVEAAFREMWRNWCGQ